MSKNELFAPLPALALSPAELSLQNYGRRANDSVFGGLDGPSDAAVTSHAQCRVAGSPLPFRVGLVHGERQLQRVQALRQVSYGRHLPALAASFGAADPTDRLSDTTLFFAEDKQTRALVGSMRLQTNRFAPLQIEGSVELPEEQHGRLLAEITRLCVLPGYAQPVRLALVKAAHLFCIAKQIGGVLAGARRVLVPCYQNLGFVDLYGDDRLLPLHHAGGLPHRVFFRDMVTSEATARECRHADYDFVFRTFHPDIAIFDAVATAFHSRSEKPNEKPPWPRAA